MVPSEKWDVALHQPQHIFNQMYKSTNSVSVTSVFNLQPLFTDDQLTATVPVYFAALCMVTSLTRR